MLEADVFGMNSKQLIYILLCCDYTYTLGKPDRMKNSAIQIHSM